MSVTELEHCLYQNIWSQSTNSLTTICTTKQNSNMVWFGLSTFFLHSSHLENIKQCHQPTTTMPAAIRWWNSLAAISRESLAPVIALRGRRGNVRPYYTSNRYYYHANTVSSQSASHAYTFDASSSSLHIYYERRAPLVPTFFKVTISLSIMDESNSI